MYKFFFSVLALGAFGLGGCTSSPTVSEGESASLQGTWTWEETQMNDDTQVTPKDVEAFTITFDPAENRVSGTTDCNNFFGSYEKNENELSFSALGSTMMFCEGSQEQEFTGHLQEITHFMFTEEGQLVLLLKYDSGSMIFNKKETLPEEEAQGGNEEESSKDYVGLSLEEAQNLAEERGVPFRVVERDGEALMATMDYRPGRINARVENDIVIGYDREGAENEQTPPESEASPFDQNSWQEMIADDCLVFFDGCNTCRRSEPGAMPACTRMFCENYEAPVCRDAENLE